MLTFRVGIMENTTQPFYEFTLALDPSTLSTAQQKKINFYTKRVFSNPKVVRTKRIVSFLAKGHRSAVRSLIGPKDHILLVATFFYKYPSNTPKKHLIDGNTKGNGADADNQGKAVFDSLGYDYGNGAALWDDDKAISTLTVKKRYTTGSPRIVIRVMRDPDHVSV